MVSPNSTYRFMDIKFVENLARAYMRIANKIETQCHRGSCGLMDKAPDFGSGDCRFESCHDRFFFPSYEPKIGVATKC